MRLTFVLQRMPWLYDYKSQFSLGILYLSTILKKSGWTIDLFDANKYEIGTIPEADVYGFSCTYNTYPDSILLANSIKIKYPKSKVIIGGSHPTLDQFNIDEIFDSIFVGEAQKTIKEFSSDFLSGTTRKYYIQTEEDDINTIFPDRSLLADEYLRTKSVFTGGKEYDSNGATSIMFTRGCPYECTFCASSALYKRKIRYRDILSIETELKNIIDVYNIRQFRVQDDTFTLNRRFFKELCEMLIKYNIFYRCSTRVNHIDDEICNLLWESGCREIGIGVETANDEVLKLYKKQITVAQIEKALGHMRKYPFVIRAFFMLGTPFDSEKTLKDNQDFIERNNIEGATVAKFLPLPGTELFNNKEKYNIKSIKEDTCMNVSRTYPFVPNIIRTDISEEEHIKIVKPFYDYLAKKRMI
jgi:anaerobic magnesium-protoporphyrin IX monomethyl ester cyclase